MSQKSGPEKETSRGKGKEKDTQESMSAASEFSRQLMDEHADRQAESQNGPAWNSTVTPATATTGEEEEAAAAEAETEREGQRLLLAPSEPASACDILRPLSEVAAQRSILLPTSGSLAWLATHQAEHADRGQNRDEDSGGDGSSMSRRISIHGPLLQSHSPGDATATTDLSDSEGSKDGPGGAAVGGSSTGGALRDFTATVWPSSSSRISTPRPARSHSASAYSWSPGSPPSSSSSALSSPPINDNNDNQQQDQEQPPIPPSPFASIFPNGTSTYPLFIQRCGESESDPEMDPNTILKYSESIQLFRRRPEDGGKLWKRRVLEYR